MAKAYKKALLSLSLAAALSAAAVPMTSSADNPIVQTMYTADGAPMVYATKVSGGYVDVDYYHYNRTEYQPALT